MKRFARWLYMLTHHDELVRVNVYIKMRTVTLSVHNPIGAGEISGAADTLKVLDLLV